MKFTLDETDVFGAATLDYYLEPKKNLSIKVEIEGFGKEKIPVSYLFRTYEEMPLEEQEALRLTKGKVLDVGACTGVHSLYLQEQGLEVFALEKSPLCCDLMQKRGVQNVISLPIEEYKGEKFDTILLLMNGLGLCEKVDNLIPWLDKFSELLNPDGQILFTSSDVSYLYTEEDGSMIIDLNGPYFGELKYKISYQKKASHFNWLFIDSETLQYHLFNTKYQLEILHHANDDSYLGKISIKP